MSLHRPLGSLRDTKGPVALTPEASGWTYTGLRVLELSARQPIELAPELAERCVLPLSAERLQVRVDGRRFDVDGRPSVFARVSDFVFVGRNASIAIVSETGGQVAVASARCEQSLPAAYGPAEDIAVEVRGAGQATRQVSNFMAPEEWDNADRLMCVEVYTPDGNWSSYPPHKHDDSPECQTNNEEIYYFRIGEAGTADYSARGFGMHRTYTADGEIGETVTVCDGDVFLIPRGYHGPCIAAPGYDMYYLNVLAGPGGERSMAFCDDPDHHWVRDTWNDQDVDPRCPLVTASGKTRGD